MVLQKEKKTGIIEKFAQTKGDTGSPEVQVSLITERITQIVEHLKTNKKDNHSRRGLLMLVGQRKKLLTYLQRKDLARHQKLIAALGLRS
ncbi:30S ribosomal protein S15 [candidate division WOR-1 bacterium RIFOXYB2_FULL_42_35]|uniref:Small ribosomal subunit protein uS15 n=1 Tax=candidate division WOR-1 bacterium RIFOXYC2_FULL_41_25 TaxID=1802586 RepID=A0A1F4TJ34_UNCSA|nr:MAG: 30S ribosomal protein S15 [candidate division WOR-1 bacterium RIFOXYA2_FULL_41_14]OGC21887.1 MAG: 30S ribosomal protein S15 [candidate division WOR-1 bacterium RIFOXYB2_FULL_42_35]OGC32751.1 MAG: 30S ribosomal protein S15 [candidate division WOR-1 bacterium RIFOXYC2_FULL_41_25]OGC42547.1 MAG: 30S ribosomal protein S15 [candidate division WOR-1 bacterium RIFOXYD2_FULL_41_8]